MAEICNCPICTSSKCEKMDSADAVYSCDNCGRIGFFDYEGMISIINGKKHLLAGYFYETNRKEKRTLYVANCQNKDISESAKKNGRVISIYDILSSERIPQTTFQKLNKALLHLYTLNDYVGQGIDINISTFPPSAAYAKSFAEVAGLCEGLYHGGYLSTYKPTTTASGTVMAYCSISVQGLATAENLLQTDLDSNKVFIATQFREVKGYFNYKVIRDIAIKPAVEDATGKKLKAFTVDEKEHNNYITDEIIAEIKTSKFVICDLTHSNLGAYWEAGFAKGLGKEVVYICNDNWANEKDESGNKKNFIHFDVNHISTIFYTDLDDLKIKLTNRIRAFL